MNIRHFFMMILMLSLLVGCQQADPIDERLIRFGLSSMPVTLDPRFATDAASYRINRLLYESLVNFDGHYKPVPALATWEKHSPQHYRFVLKKPLSHFYGGQVLTAKDVQATYQSILSEASKSPHRGGLSHIEKIEIGDGETIDFFLSRADPLFPGRLTIGILPENPLLENHLFNRDPIGSGSFHFVRWNDSIPLRLQRISDDQIVEFHHVADPTVRVLKLKKGEINLLQNDLPRELVAYMVEQPDIQIEKGRGTNFTYLGFNLDDPITSDINLRRAIGYALNREEIIQYLLADAARPASSLLPPDHWAGNKDLPLLEHDIEKAKALIEKSGLPLPIRITYKTSSNPLRIRIATLIQHQLAKVGIEVDVKSYDWGTFYGDIKAGRFQMFSLSWVGIKTPDIFRYVFHQEAIPPNGANRGRYRNTEVDRLIELADKTESLAQQAEYYRQLQAILFADLPYVPLWYEDHFYAARKGWVGYTLAPDGNYDGLKTVKWAR